jgi:cytochrome c-type biogenesis protein
VTPDLNFSGLVVLPLGLGLLGFVEPCSVGSTLIFLKHLEGKERSAKLTQVAVFATTRALFIGLLGIFAVLLGNAFLGFQRGAWIALGAIYVALGLLYVLGKAGALMVSIGPNLARLSDSSGAATLGILFGLNIPACAGPLIFALLGAAAAGGAEGVNLASGFISLATFGLALSSPLVAAVFFKPARTGLDWIAALSRRLPFWTGLLLIALGAWSIWLALSPHQSA